MNRLKCLWSERPASFSRSLMGAIAAMLLFLLSGAPWALTFILPYDSSSIVGEVFTIYVEPGDTLHKIARKYDMGYEEVVRANPHLNPWKPKPWSKVIIPSAFILPDATQEGIVINLPEMRLYYYHEDGDTVSTFPIGVGRQGWVTPIGRSRIIEKKESPEWDVPESIQAYMAEKGVELPDIVPPGPNNPLGDYAMRLDFGGYLIHGTNKPTSVGKRSSSGCIRMYPEDIEELFYTASLGARVRIVNQPYKAGWYNDELYLESHKPFWDQLPKRAQYGNIRSVVEKVNSSRDIYIDWEQVYTIHKRFTGFPAFIGGL